MRRIPCIGLWFLLAVAIVVATGCEQVKAPVAPAVNVRDSVPIMTSYGVSKLISDSGVIRYKVIAEEWQVYDRTNPKKHVFEQGILLQRFDQKFHTEMYITADTAYWYNENLWKLVGRVKVWQADGTVFTSELLFWNMERHEFYSYKYSHLKSPEREVEGNSFLSNETMTYYRVNVPKGWFPLPAEEDEAAAATTTPAEMGDTIAAADTLPAPEPERPEPRRKSSPTIPSSEPLPPGHFR